MYGIAFAASVLFVYALTDAIARLYARGRLIDHPRRRTTVDLVKDAQRTRIEL